MRVLTLLPSLLSERQVQCAPSLTSDAGGMAIDGILYTHEDVIRAHITKQVR